MWLPRYQTAIKVEQEFGKRKLNLDLSRLRVLLKKEITHVILNASIWKHSSSSLLIAVPDVISIDSSEDENQHDASVLSDNDANR